MQFCEKKNNRKIQRKYINVDFLLSKLFFFGVSSMGLRTMVTVNKLSLADKSEDFTDTPFQNNISSA